jgi:hypothetical protein
MKDRLRKPGTLEAMRTQALFIVFLDRHDMNVSSNRDARRSRRLTSLAGIYLIAIEEAPLPDLHIDKHP